MTCHVLIIEDDEGQAELIEGFLSERGYRVTVSASAEAGLAFLRSDCPDLLICDLMLPGDSGFSVMKEIRSNPDTSAMPLIVLTALVSEKQRILGLEAGADDYITKPFFLGELGARIEALLRRTVRGSRQESKLRLRDLVVDLARRRTHLADRPLALRRKEFDLLVLLLEKRGRVLSKDFIANALWVDEEVVSSNTINTHVKNLRQKLGTYAGIVETVIGVGYRINVPEEK
ncbi:MAG: response regulator transcription factor [Elusimicrobia bacterium]|nr:response regulator transcription factor [Elusimicrobiota bacterium]